RSSGASSWRACTGCSPACTAGVGSRSSPPRRASRPRCARSVAPPTALDKSPPGRYAPCVPPLHHLSPRSAEILAAVIRAIRPRGHGFDQPIDDDVLVEIDRTVPFMPRPLQLLFPAGLRLLEWGPLALTGRPVRMTRMSREAALEYCERWLHS